MELVVNGSSVRMIQLWTVEAGHRVAVYDFVVEPGHTGKRSAQEVASATVFRANCAHDTSSLSTTAPASVADTLKAPPRRPRPGKELTSVCPAEQWLLSGDGLLLIERRQLDDGGPKEQQTLCFKRVLEPTE